MSPDQPIPKGVNLPLHIFDQRGEAAFLQYLNDQMQNNPSAAAQEPPGIYPLPGPTLVERTHDAYIFSWTLRRGNRYVAREQTRPANLPKPSKPAHLLTNPPAHSSPNSNGILTEQLRVPVGKAPEHAPPA